MLSVLQLTCVFLEQKEHYLWAVGRPGLQHH